MSKVQSVVCFAGLICTALGTATHVASADAPAAFLSPTEIVAKANAADWHDIPTRDLMVMTLANGRMVTIQLSPIFSPLHVANIRKLAAAQWWDGTSINRVQDNYVTQWGDATEKKPLPSGLALATKADYETMVDPRHVALISRTRDVYAHVTGFLDGWPIAMDPVTAQRPAQGWLPHCYGMIGVGRDLPPDAGSGAELYAVNGHAPRHLDRNLAVVGRVIDGMDALSALPRGTGALGFYEKPEQRLTITSVRMMADLPPTAQTHWQVMDTSASTFARYADARSNRRDPFFIRPSGVADICNIPVPIRRAP